jgi:hypothetical protein
VRGFLCGRIATFVTPSRWFAKGSHADSTSPAFAVVHTELARDVGQGSLGFHRLLDGIRHDGWLFPPT